MFQHFRLIKSIMPDGVCQLKFQHFRLIKSIMPDGVCQQILDSGMLHDVVLCKDPEYMMRTLPIKLMEPVSILFADLVGFTAMSSTVSGKIFPCVHEPYNSADRKYLIFFFSFLLLDVDFMIYCLC